MCRLGYWLSFLHRLPPPPPPTAASLLTPPPPPPPPISLLSPSPPTTSSSPSLRCNYRLIARLCTVLAKELETAALDPSAALVAERLSVKLDLLAPAPAATAAAEEEQELAPSDGSTVVTSHSDPANRPSDKRAMIRQFSDSNPPPSWIPLFTSEQRIASTEGQAVAAVVFLRLICPAIVRGRCIPAKHGRWCVNFEKWFPVRCVCVCVCVCFKCSRVRCWF
jgi:hypothetical protein